MGQQQDSDDLSDQTLVHFESWTGQTQDNELQREFRPGDIVDGSYEVLRLIGAGGMGYVYRVRHLGLNKEFALKTLSLDSLDDKAWARFQNEARAIAKINHPNIVTIYNQGIHQSQKPYYVMDLLSGKTLSGLLDDRGHLAWEEALPIFIEVCSGLGFAHKSGIIHRDIKPENLLLLDQPQNNCHVKIFDFGIAKLAGAVGPNNQQLTRTGEIFGSPLYMSPEQANGGALNARSDIYSLGCSLFEVLTGSPPFTGKTAMETLMMHQTKPAPTLQEACGRIFPDMLEAAVAALLAKAPKDRYQTCELLSQDLRKILEGQSAPIKPFFITPQLSYDETSENESNFERAGQFANDSKKSKVIPVVGFALVALLCSSIGLAAFWTKPKGAPAQTAKKESTFTLDNVTPKDYSRVFLNAPLEGLREPGQVPKSIEQKTPFCKHIKVNGVATKHFEFPSDVVIGKIADESMDFEPATGPVDLPDKQDTMLQLGQDIADYPQYASRFKPGDINYVLIQGRDADRSYLEAARQIPGFTRMSIQDCQQIKASDLKQLKVDQTLTGFDFGKCTFTADDVAKLPWIANVETVACVHEKSLTKLLTALAAPRKKELHLTLFSCKLTRQDFLLLSRQPRLTNLVLCGSNYSKSDLSLLSTVRDLSALQLGDCEFDSNLIEILRPLKQLKMIITTNEHDPASIAAMHRALPTLILEHANRPQIEPSPE